MDALAGIFAAGLVAQVVFWTVVTLLFPVFWVWMLIDAAVRQDTAYKGGRSERFIWIAVMLLFQLAAVVYFFVVFRAVGGSDSMNIGGAVPA